ncbi:1-aminocyclopropane-1-carboxylate oxidase-like [Bradysia coprophila]|uniref:1-aminocyclopropane-1-carboxylate oxidase-like n=1 Tax=Bradysia coprophila TaxID=38358 RepID=UPI00187DCE6C|nr:1-aminocyclopropane-1-carboxylate oxidase-like [Bradysia coprophila]
METLNGIHIIDCKSICTSPLNEIQDTNEFQAFAERFGNGLKRNGIVYLINTAVDKTAVSNLEQKLTQFFRLPSEVKETYRPQTFGLSKYGSWGWKGPFKKVVAETLDFTSNPRFEEDSLYPTEISEFKEAMMAFRKQSKDLMIKLLRSLGEYLELADKDFLIHQHRAFEENYEMSKCSVRSVYYPKALHDRKTSVQLRLPEHQDFGTINMIRQSAEGGGLQAKLYNRKWVDVPHIEDSFVLLAARCLEMYSGGNIPAVYHRIAWTNKSETEDRLSFGCFWGPDRDTCVLSQVEENPNWKPAYARMQPGEIFDDYYHKEKPGFFATSNNIRNRKSKTSKMLTVDQKSL